MVFRSQEKHNSYLFALTHIFGLCPRVTENREHQALSAFSSNAGVVLVFSELINNSRT